MQEKYCSGCDQNLPLESFHLCYNGLLGRHRYCKTCRKVKDKRQDPEKRRLRNLRYRHANPEKARELSRRGHQSRKDDPTFKEQARQRANKHYHSKTVEERREMRRLQCEADPEDYHRKRLNQHLRSTYGITVERFEEMFREQQGCCAICGQHQENCRRRLAVDHCHASGKVRQLLCDRCNLFVGHIETPELMQKTLDYIARHA